MESRNLEEDVMYAEVGNFFENNDKLHDVVFIVGEQQEKIKAVKLLLINQSRTWWSMLSEDSPLVEKDDIHLPDIDPEVFNLLLRHSYGGLDKLDDLSDDMVVKLCYCANKYFMKTLMAKIAARLQPKDVDSVFPALHCLTYYNLHGVEEGVKKIVQSKIRKIFEHAEFLECDVDSVTYICKQDTLNCDELTLWKAVVSWAKHKAQGGEGAQLRPWMTQPLQHIRLLTLSKAELYDDVFSTEILNSKEIASICKDNCSGVSSICSENSVRHCTTEEPYSIITVVIQQTGRSGNSHFELKDKSNSSFLTKHTMIVLQSIICKGYVDPSDFTEYKDDLHSLIVDVNITITITRITDLMKNTSDDEPVILQLDQFAHHCFDRTSIPTVVNNKGITLLANSKYKVELTFNKNMPCWKAPECVSGHEFEHGTFHCSLTYNNGVGVTPGHIVGFTYGVAGD